MSTLGPDGRPYPEETPATRVEPRPTAGSGVDVLPSLLERVEALGLPFASKLRADLEARSAFGEAKYGTRLRAWNGRDAAVDAYQEALDLLMYLHQCELRSTQPLTGILRPALQLASLLQHLVGYVPVAPPPPVPVHRFEKGGGR